MMNNFKTKVSRTPLTIDQIKELLGVAERTIAEIKKMVANNLSPTGAEYLLMGLFDDLEYKIAVMTDDEETLATFQD
jgi:hypothetical protein